MLLQAQAEEELLWQQRQQFLRLPSHPLLLALARLLQDAGTIRAYPEDGTDKSLHYG